MVDEYNNIHRRTIKTKPVDVKSKTYIESSEVTDDKDPKFKIDDKIRISKYKNIYAKDYTLVRLKKFL